MRRVRSDRARAQAPLFVNGSGARSNPWLYVCVALVLAALRFSQLPFSHPADADEYLSHVAAIGPFDHIGTWSVFGEVAAHFRSEAPGWFPLGPLPLALWLTGISVPGAKIVQYVLVLVSFVLFAFVARKLSGSRGAAILAVVAALCAWQFRTIHDPAIGTSFLTPWSAIAVLGAYGGWLAYRDSGRIAVLVLCYVALAFAVATGPVAWCLGALLAFIALRSERRPAAFGLCGIVLAGIAAIVASGPPPAPWQHEGGLGGNLFAQLFAAIPASFRAVGNLPVARVADLYYGTRYIDDRFVLIPPVTLAGWAFAVASAAVAYVVSSATSPAEPARRGGDALIVGAGFWLVPSLVLGRPGEWQHGLPIGQAFEGVYFEYFGVALLAAVGLRRVLASKHLAARLVPALAALTAFALAYGNARSDAYALAWTARLDEPAALVARAGHAGFFDRLPGAAVIAPSSSLPFARWGVSGIADPKYALYDDTGKRFATVPYGFRTPAAPQTWILDAPLGPGVRVALLHVARTEAGKPLVDRALGYAVDRAVRLDAPGLHRGVARTVVALRDGASIDARRRCGPVPPAVAFAPSRPQLVWGGGFLPSGPYGYVTAPLEPVRSALGKMLTVYPKMFLEGRGVATIVPSSCPPGTVVFRAVAVASKPAHLAVRTPAGVERFAIDDEATPVVLRIPLRDRAPFKIEFSTDAPAAQWEPIYFRYERDRPVKRRVVVQPYDVWETP
jgi:hypothetical protein